MSADTIIARKEVSYLKRLPEVRPIAGVVAHAKLMHGEIPLGVVSGSPRESVIHSLELLGLRDLFQIIVGGDDTERGKPHPDSFLLAAKFLGVRPEDCLVFEDGEMGIQAASAAGMAWVKVERNGGASAPTETLDRSSNE